MQYRQHITQAIILAGGLGTRLREAVPDLPKCMAPVAGRPFLFYVIRMLRLQGVEKIIFSLGYKHEVIEDWLAKEFSRMQYECVVEEEPLGTGGAIRLACSKTTEENIIVTNGDTLYNVNAGSLFSVHLLAGADCTLALKPMHDFDRYGVVEINQDNIVTSFREKKFYRDGLINGGLYIINTKRFMARSFPQKLSFEKDFLEIEAANKKIAGQAQDGYFIDIGIPADYNKAQQDFKKPALDLKAIDKSWTLFLDRDGVINVDNPGGYILNADEFVFLDKLIPAKGDSAFKKFAEKFGHTIVITNQRGVGRGLMTEEDLISIHQKMEAGINSAGGKLDAIYYCTAENKDHPYRKPNPGMAFKAKAGFPDIDFSRSIMVGNNLSDMSFGRNAGMYTVFVRTTAPDTPFPHPDIDMAVDSLADFAKVI